MAPILDESTNLPDNCKFVRGGKNIAYALGGSHLDIAEKHDLGTPHVEGLSKRDVDDAGQLFNYGEKIFVGGFPTTCRVIGDPKIAREETANLVGQITGKEIRF